MNVIKGCLFVQLICDSSLLPTYEEDLNRLTARSGNLLDDPFASDSFAAKKCDAPFCLLPTSHSI